jgi:hypothetical protein
VLSILQAQRGQMAGEVQLVVQAFCLLSLVIELMFTRIIGEIYRK